jgi:thiamine-phosphate pyrophosphorylase
MSGHQIVLITGAGGGIGAAAARAFAGDGLAKVVAQAPGSVIALGGVTAENAALCRAAGAHGVAVMGGVMRAANPRAAVELLLQSISSN